MQSWTEGSTRAASTLCAGANMRHAHAHARARACACARACARACAHARAHAHAHAHVHAHSVSCGIPRAALPCVAFAYRVLGISNYHVNGCMQRPPLRDDMGIARASTLDSPRTVPRWGTLAGSRTPMGLTALRLPHRCVTHTAGPLGT